MPLESISITKLDVYLGLAVGGLFTGLGAALGTYLANKHVIDGTKKLIDKMKGKNKINNKVE